MHLAQRAYGLLVLTAVLAITAIALIFAVYSSVTIVSLLLLGYAGVTQFFPGVVLGLFSKRISGPGVFAGIIVGIFAVTFLMLTGRDPWMGLNAGFVALCLNFAVVAAVSLAQRARPAEDMNIF